MSFEYPIAIKDLPLPTTDTFNEVFEMAKAALMEHGIKLEHPVQTGKFIMSWQNESQVLEDFVLDNKFITYEYVGSTYHKITTVDNIFGDAVAYKMGNILIFDTKQKKVFFNKILDEAKVNDRIKDAVIKRVLFAMGLVVDVKEETPVYVSSNYNEKVRINGKETRVLKLDIKKIMED